jgi:hypothetical protein
VFWNGRVINLSLRSFTTWSASLPQANFSIFRALSKHVGNCHSFSMINGTYNVNLIVLNMLSPPLLCNLEFTVSTNPFGNNNILDGSGPLVRLWAIRFLLSFYLGISIAYNEETTVFWYITTSNLGRKLKSLVINSLQWSKWQLEYAYVCTECANNSVVFHQAFQTHEQRKCAQCKLDSIFKRGKFIHLQFAFLVSFFPSLFFCCCLRRSHRCCFLIRNFWLVWKSCMPSWYSEIEGNASCSLGLRSLPSGA